MRDLNTLTENDTVVTEFDAVTAEQRFRIDPTVIMSEPPAVIYMVNDDGKEIPTFTLGSFSSIIGKAKSKKTYFTVLLIASFMGYVNSRIKGRTHEKPFVLWFDTEQSPYHLTKMVQRCCRLIGESNPANLKVYMLRTCTTEERVKLIDYTIRENPAASLVVIDGIRDLVYDINSPEEATTTATRLMKWSVENDIHIINVLHQNKGDANARGHLGTELTNKAESIISIEVSDDPAISTVTAEYTRDIEFKSFSFTINDESLPVLCELPESASRKRTEPNFILDELHVQILSKIFRDRIDLKYKEVCQYIKLEFAEAGTIFGDNRSRDYLAYYIKKGWVNRDEKTKKYSYEKAIF